MKTLQELGANLRASRKKAFPKDGLKEFALRLGVARATLQRMEAGDLSVSMEKYYRAGELLGKTELFSQLLAPTQSLFDD